MRVVRQSGRFCEVSRFWELINSLLSLINSRKSCNTYFNRYYYDINNINECDLMYLPLFLLVSLFVQVE